MMPLVALLCRSGWRTWLGGLLVLQGARPPEATSPLGLRALDIEGRVHVLGQEARSKGFALVVLGVDCPIARESLPELDRLARRGRELDLELFGVISDPFATLAEAQKLWREARPSFPLLFDANGVLARRLQPSATPEAFLHDAHGRLVYRGRIDDRGRQRIGANVAERRDLLAALEALGAGRAPPTARTGAIGCTYEGWPEPMEREVTWSRNVAPLVDLHCTSCHGAGGGAPFALERYEDAARRSKMIARVALERAMPPWHAVPGFGELAHERALDAWEIGALERWSSSGAKRGEEAEALRLRQRPAPALAAPDLVRHAPPTSLPPDGPDRMLELPLAPEPGAAHLRAIELRFSDPRVVRSAILFLTRRDQEGGAESARRALATWVPGQLVEPLPEGAGHALRAGDVPVLWLHLHPQGVATELAASVALWQTAEPVTGEVVLLPLHAGSTPRTSLHEGYGLDFEQRIEERARLLALHPRLGAAGIRLKLVAREGESEVPLLWVQRWDPYWAERYALRRPRELPRDSVLRVEAVFHDPLAGRTPFLAPPELLSAAPGLPPPLVYLELLVPLRAPTDSE